MAFSKFGLNSIWYGAQSWVDWNFGVFVVVILLLIYIFALISGSLGFLISKKSESYITMMLKAIPLFVILGIYLGINLFNRPFLFKHSPLLNRWLVKGYELWVVLGLGILTFVLVTVGIKRIKSKELDY